MRRAEREVTDINEMLSIIESCDATSLALMDGEYPYVIEMNFGYTYENDKLTLYFHGAKEGKKHSLVAKNNHAAFSMSTYHEFVGGSVGCASTFKYKSVCGVGDISIVEGDERMKALSVIMAHYDKEREHVFSEKHAAAVTVLKLDVKSFTGKRRITK